MTLEETTTFVLENIKNGDKFAFDKLVSLYEKQVYRLCHRFFNDEEDALDATQEVFVKVFRYINKFEGRSSFSTWIYRITANTCMTLSEKKKKEKEGLLQLMMGWWKSFSSKTLEDEVLGKSEQMFNKEIVSESLTRIPEVYRIPVIMKDIEGLPMEKISEALEIPVGTVKSRLNRGRAMLHDKLEVYVRGAENE